MVASRQMRVHLSPTRGIAHYFMVFFDYTHLCSVDFMVYGYLTNVHPGLSRSPSLSNNLQSLVAYEGQSKQTWKDVIAGTRPSVSCIYFTVHCLIHLSQCSYNLIGVMQTPIKVRKHLRSKRNYPYSVLTIEFTDIQVLTPVIMHVHEQRIFDTPLSPPSPPLSAFPECLY